MEGPLGSCKGPRYRLRLSLQGHTKESCRSQPLKATAGGFCAHSGASDFRDHIQPFVVFFFLSCPEIALCVITY